MHVLISFCHEGIEIEKMLIVIAVTFLNRQIAYGPKACHDFKKH